MLRREIEVRRKKIRRVVTPVIGQAFLDEAPVVEMKMHRHQLDRGDAQAQQVLDDRLGSHARVSPLLPLGDLGMAHRHPLTCAS